MEKIRTVFLDFTELVLPSSKGDFAQPREQIIAEIIKVRLILFLILLIGMTDPCRNLSGLLGFIFNST
jgi:hypothetical protein